MAKTTQRSLIPLILELEAKRAVVQTKLDAGTPVTELAIQYKVTPYSMNRTLREMGFKMYNQARDDGKKSPLLGDLLTVLHRICDQLDIPHDEIKQYL